MADLECDEESACRSGKLTSEEQSLKDRIVRQIRMDGPMPVSAYMQACLHDPVHGYYASRPGLGTDFTTAPEISQMFGELIGGWIAYEWQEMGAPQKASLVELGPGRGTLMADALRAIRTWPAAKALDVHLLEASPPLREVQAARLSEATPRFLTWLDDIPPGPFLIIANEFLDCLPARQFVRDGGIWREQVVGAGPDGDLVFGLDASEHDMQGVQAAQAAAMVEVQPGLDGIVATLAARVRVGDPFRALFIDYGPDDRAPGDSLRAYHAGRQVPPLAMPGDADLTVDVDFGRLARLAASAGLDVAGPLTQRAFLAAIGIQERLTTLSRSAPDEAPRLYEGARCLVDPDEMGARFKVICLSSPGLPLPAGFAAI